MFTFFVYSMKKILFVFSFFLLFFGFSTFAETWTFNYPWSATSTSTTFKQSIIFNIWGVAWRTINLYQIQQKHYNGVNCQNFTIYTTTGAIYTWDFVNITWLTLVDIPLSTQTFYNIQLHTSWWNCTVARWTYYNQPTVLSWRFNFIWYSYSSVLFAPALTYSVWIDKLVFSWNDPIFVPDIYTVTSPSGTQTISNDITISWNVNFDSGYPNFEVSSQNNYTINYDYASNTFQNTKNSSWFNIYLSWYWYTSIKSWNDYVFSFPFCSGALPPSLPRSGLYLEQVGSFDTVNSWNVMGQFAENISKLALWNIGNIILVLSSFFVIWLILKLFWIRRKTRKQF